MEDNDHAAIDAVARNLARDQRVLGVGVDIEPVDRFAPGGDANDPAFREKVFTATERAECNRKVDPAQSLAARFAGKEAVLKALTDAGLGTPPLWDIEITTGGRGAPRVRLPRAPTLTAVTARVSLTHAGGMAVAFAVVVTGTDGS